MAIPTQYSYLLVNANGYDKIPWFWAWGRTPFMWFNVFYLGKPLDLEPTTLQTKDKKKNVTKWNHFFLGASQRLEACAILCKSLESIGSGHPFHDSLFFRTFSMDQNWDKPKSSKSLCHRMGLVLVLTCFSQTSASQKMLKMDQFWCWHVFLKLLVLTCFSQTRASQKMGKID